MIHLDRTGRAEPRSVARRYSGALICLSVFIIARSAAPQNVLLWEDFSDGLPADWTVQDGGLDGATWTAISPDNNPNGVSFDNMDDYFAFVEFVYPYPNAPDVNASDESLVTPELDFTGLAGASLQCSISYDGSTDEDDDNLVVITIEVDPDGNDEWTPIYRRANGFNGIPEPGQTNVHLNVSEYVAGKSTVRFRFRWQGVGAVTFYGHFALDTVLVMEEEFTNDVNYIFQQLTPALQQPWYFNNPMSLAQARTGEIYIADMGSNRIVSVTGDGKLIRKWGGKGSDDRKFDRPASVAVAPDGIVYVADVLNDRVQQFSSGGEWIQSIDHDFGKPVIVQEIDQEKLGVVIVDSEGNLYASSREKLFKYDASGQPLPYTPNLPDPSPYGFYVNYIQSMVFDDEGNLFVGRSVPDGGESSVTKLDPSGKLLAYLRFPYNQHHNERFGIAVDRDGTLLVKHRSSSTLPGLLRYSAELDETPLQHIPDIFGDDILALNDGRFLVADHPLDSMTVYEIDETGARVCQVWGPDVGNITRNAYETTPAIDLDAERVYAADTDNNQIVTLDFNGRVLDSIPLTFSPKKVFLDADQNLVASGTANGNSAGAKISLIDKTLLDTYDVDIDGIDRAGNLYDLGLDKTEKYDPAGSLINSLDIAGTALAVGEDGRTYTIDSYNDQIKVFNASGALEKIYFADAPTGLAVATVKGEERIHVYEWNRIRILNAATGKTIGIFGGRGSNPGQFFQRDPIVFWRTVGQSVSIDVDEKGHIFVYDTGHRRLQEFRPFDLLSNAKAIIVAAGGPYPGNNLWSATQANANFAYFTLVNQGFTKETIYYLSSDTNLDLDDNGEADDVDADCTRADLQYAIEQWAPAALNDLPTENVVVYIVNHGGVNSVRLNDAELLAASELNQWLSTLESGISGTLTVVYDACESGTFIDDLGGSTGSKATLTPRVVLTSTSPGESAHFVTQGSISFSNYFWEGVFNGVSIYDSFDLSRTALIQALPQTSHQTPLINDNGNSAGNDATDGALASGIFIGNATTLFSSAPSIEAVGVEEPVNSTATIWADPVTDPDGVDRVWAVLRPPNFKLSDTENALSGLPTIELMDPDLEDDQHRYQAVYSQFTETGEYSVLIYAIDKLGNTSKPELTSVHIGDPLTRRAVIVASGGLSHPEWPGIQAAATSAYEALLFQGYEEDDIYYMSSNATAGFDATPELNDFSFRLSPGQHADTHDLLVYLIGPSVDGGIVMAPGEVLDAATFDCLLDELQGSDCNGDEETAEIGGKVTVVYDCSESTTFLSKLLPPAGKEHDRILVGSTDVGQRAQYLSNGSISFSKFFWVRVLNGADTFAAYSHARGAMRLAGRGQLAFLDDTGDGANNVIEDGAIAGLHSIGVGVLLAGDDPIIGSIAMPEGSGKALSVSLEASGITSTGIIDRVWGVVAGPGNNIVTVELTKTGDGEYSSSYNGFEKYGAYTVAVYATDTDGNTSLPRTFQVTNETGEDIYEPDNTASGASWIGVARPDTLFQPHNFHEIGDVDWVAFDAVAGDLVEIEAFNVGDTANVRARLYERDGTTLILEDSTGLDGTGGAYIPFFVPADGRYLVEVVNLLGTAGEGAHYDLRVFKPEGPCGKSLGISISVEDSDGNELDDVTVRVENPEGDEIDLETDSVGNALFSGMEIEGEYTIQVEAPVGYLEVDSFAIDLFCISDEDGQTVPETVVLTKVEAEPILQVTPVEYAPAEGMNDVEFEIVNDGTGNMPWAAEVLSESEDWIEIVSDSSDPGDNGNEWSILVDVEKNLSPHPRKGWLRIEATGATGSPREVYVHQEGDTVPPTVYIKGANPIILKRKFLYSDPGATATDDVAGDLTSSITTESTLDTSKAGTYYVTYTVADAAGNTTTKSRTVFVLDEALPIRVNPMLTLFLLVFAIAALAKYSRQIKIGG